VISHAVSTLFVLFCVTVASAAAQPVPKTVVYDHLSGTDATLPIALKAKEAFVVSIQNTCPTEFDYKLVGLKKKEEQTVSGPPGGEVPLTTVTLTGEYDPQYSGYQVVIARKPDPKKCVFPGTATPADLKEVRPLVSVTAIEWEYAQDAALTLTAGIDRHWTARPKDAKFEVVRDGQNEDPVRANFATLTHFYAPARNWGPALGFGLVDNNAEYYFGLSHGLGERNKRILNIAYGVVYSPIARLPHDVHEGDLLDDPAKLKDFGTGHAFRPFVAFTATFFRSTSTDAKPTAKPQ
jgi:hypothetical protein